MNKVIPIFIPHAGCPHLCVFCNQSKISGQKEVSLKAVEQQIMRYLQWIKPSLNNEIAFYGGSFTALPLGLQKSLLMIADKYISNGYAGSVRISTRPDYIDDNIAKFLEDNHVSVIELGIQSLDNKVLEKAERGHTQEQSIAAVNLLKKYQFKVGMQLMVGLEEQSFESVKQMAEITTQLKPDIARIYPVLVIKDTVLADKYASGSYMPLTLEEAIRQTSFLNKELTKAGIKVIRLGLQADEELCEPGNIVAGPFHPSFGELVKSYDYRLQVAENMVGIDFHDHYLVLSCPSKLLSQVKGLNKCNQHYWEQNLPSATLKILIDESLNEVNISFPRREK